MVFLNPITLTHEEFQTAPVDERIFYLKIGALSNEISILNKMLLFSIRGGSDQEVVSRASSTLAALHFRMLAGRLYESRDIITSGYKPLRLRYRGNKNNELNRTYKLINAYFAVENNFIKLIRHKLAFHTDHHTFTAGVDAIPASETFTDYMCKERGNTLFWSGELALIASLVYISGEKETNGAFQKMFKDITRVAGLMNDFAFLFARSFYDRNFPHKRIMVENETLKIEDCPILMGTSISYFYESPSAEEIRQIKSK